MTTVVTRFAFLILLVAICGGCSTRECAGAHADGEWYSPLTSPALGTDDAVAMADRAGARPLQILVLTGGGQNGAFGAGFLNGWGRTGTRPVFDIVSGVSTGAMQATFAFLGEPRDDEALMSAYLDVDASDIYEKRFFLAVFFSDSIYKTDPLQRTIARTFPDALIDRVAEAGAGGRQLWVGTLNLDRGATTSWNMVALAAEAKATANPELYDRFRSILLASAAVPVVFSPVIIDGDMHVDGSAREPVFLRRVLGPTCKVLAERLKTSPEAPRPVLHAIFNAKIGIGYACVDDEIDEIGKRIFRVANDEATLGFLHQLAAFAAAGRLDWRMARIPDAEAVPEDQNQIDRAAMRRLFDVGVRRGGEASSWETSIPEPPAAPPSDVVK